MYHEHVKTICIPTVVASYILTQHYIATSCMYKLNTKLVDLIRVFWDDGLTLSNSDIIKALLLKNLFLRNQKHATLLRHNNGTVTYV